MKCISSIITSIFIMLLLPACGAAFQTAQTIPPTTQVALPSEPAVSPATSTSSTPVIWSVYHNDQVGFTFEYPAAYDGAPYKDACGIKEINDGIHLGNRIDLLFMESNGLNLTEYANNLLQNKGWTSDSLKNVTVNGREAVTVEYRFGGTNRFGTFTLVGNNLHILALNFSAGIFCEIPEAKISEPEVYSHILETLQFDP